jgi:hypothetical protein
LHLSCLPPSPKKERVPIKTIGEVCREQAMALIQALIVHAHEKLTQGQDVGALMTALFAKQGLLIAN